MNAESKKKTGWIFHKLYNVGTSKPLVVHFISCFKSGCEFLNDGLLKMFSTAHTGGGEENGPEPFGVAFHHLISQLLL